MADNNQQQNFQNQGDKVDYKTLPEPSLDRTQSNPLDSNSYDTTQKCKKKLNVMAKAFQNDKQQQQQQQQQQQSQQQQQPQQLQQQQQQPTYQHSPQQFIPQQQQPQMYFQQQSHPMMMNQMPYPPQNQMIGQPPYLPPHMVQPPIPQQYQNPQNNQFQSQNQFEQQQNQSKLQKKMKVNNSSFVPQLFSQNEWDLKVISKPVKQNDQTNNDNKEENTTQQQEQQQQQQQKQEEQVQEQQQKEEKKLSPIEELQNLQQTSEKNENNQAQNVVEEDSEETPTNYIINYSVLFKMVNNKRKEKLEIQIFSKDVQTIFNREKDISKSTFKPQQQYPGKKNYYQGGGGQSQNYSKGGQGRNTPEKKSSEQFNKYNYNQYQGDAQTSQSNPLLARQPDDPEKQRLKEISNKWVKEKSQLGNQDVKQIKLNMNKLAPENQERIFPILANVAKNSKECTETLVKQIIEKSWNEPKYQKTYSELCQYLSDKEELLFDMQVKSNQKLNYFKNFLLQCIQSAFETGKEILENSKLDESQKKKKILGNVNFIGELYKAKVINIKIIQICTNEMMKKFICEYQLFYCNNSDKVYKNFENSLEGILVLYEKVGPEVEKISSKKQSSSSLESDKQWLSAVENFIKKINETNQMQNVEFSQSTVGIEFLFKALNYLKQEAKISQRVSCLIENLTQRRASNWEETFFQSEGPKKIDQIHKEFNDELEQIDIRAAEYYQQQNEKQNQNSYYYQEKSYQNVQYFAKEEQKVQTKVYVKKETNQQSSANKEQSIQQQAQLKDAPKAKLDFSVNRTGAAKKVTNPPQVHKLPYHVIEERLKDMFKHLDKNAKVYEDDKGETITEQYTQDDYHKEAKDLYKQAQGIGFFQCFLLIFADGNLLNIKKRIEVISQLLQEHVIDKDLFLKELQVSLKKMGDFFDDMPYLGQGLAQIYYEFTNQGLVKYQDVPKPEEYLDKANENFEDNVIIQKDFLQNFISSSLKVLKEHTQVQKYIEDIEQLVVKMKFEEGEDWFASLKTKFT